MLAHPPTLTTTGAYPKLSTTVPAIHHLPLGTDPVPAWALWARLPLQLVLIAWAWLFARARR